MSIGSVIKEICDERVRQRTVEGWTAEHDDEHKRCELAMAAACYAMPEDRLELEKVLVQGPPCPPTADPGTTGWGPFYDCIPKHWPWDLSWWKPKDRRRDLVRAGALIVAEIERLDRLASSAGDKP